MKKSKGHIAFVKDNEYFIGSDGEVYRAQITDAFDTRSKNRIGRWECSLSHAMHYAQVLGLNKNDVKKAAKKLKLKESHTVRIKKSVLKQMIREVLLEAEQISVFDITTVDKFMKDLSGELKRIFPHVKVSKMTLGGDERVTVFAHLSLDDPKTWSNKIYHNSRYLIVSFSRDGIIKETSSFSSRETKTKFRKSRFKDLKGAVVKLKQWRDKHKNTKNYW